VIVAIAIYQQAYSQQNDMKKPFWFVLFIPLFIPLLNWANEKVHVSIAVWQFEDIDAENLNVDMHLSSQGIGVIASADSIRLADPIGTIKAVTLRCDALVIIAEKLSCSRGILDFSQQDLGKQSIRFEAFANQNKEKYKIEISGLKLASAKLSLTAIINAKQWQVFADTPQIELSPLTQFLSPYLSKNHRDALNSWSYEGTFKLHVEVAGQGSELKSINLDLNAEQLNLSDSKGKYVSEAVTSKLNVSAVHTKQQWQWKSTLNINNGQAYGEPVFIDFTDTPFKVQAEGVWFKETEQLQITMANLSQGSVMQVSISGQASLSQLSVLKIEMAKTNVAKLYEVWGQPFTLGTSIDKLELSGEIAFNYQQHADNYSLSAHLDNVFIADQANNFSFDSLSGVIGWSNFKQTEKIDLQWHKGSIYALSLGASTFKAEVKNAAINLQQPWVIPVLDGELSITDFNLQQLENELPQWEFAGNLTPISMTSLSSALKWPLMHGKLSGVIPKVSYKNQQIKIDGSLKVNLFEGETIITDLQLEQPFGVLPQLQSNIIMNNINLEILTQTFDFGKITGKLNGKVAGLRLSNWQPVQFDAIFSTPVADKSRRRISQKAVDNLSQIGGGATGILQRSILGLFEEFSYQRLGLSCKLRNDVCAMSGVGEAEQGYYIVKGGGLPPRINVVGYTRRVNWPDLIERLKAVNNSNGNMVIE